MVFEGDGQFTIPNYKMDYYHYQKEPAYLDRSCNVQMDDYKYGPEKMTKRSSPNCKEPVEGFNEYSSLFSSKTYSRISNSILSYIVGGFVGSKSQMNNNKHNLSYDLSAVIFNLLNPCKYERERSSSKRCNEMNFYSAASKINPDSYEKYIVGRSSQKCEQVNGSGMDIMELKCLMLPFEDLVDPNHFILNINKQYNSNSESVTNNCSNNPEERNFGDLHSCDDSDESRKLTSKIGDDEIISYDTTDHVCESKKIENLESVGGSTKNRKSNTSGLEITNKKSESLFVNTKVKPTGSYLADSPTIIISLPCDNSNKMKEMAADSTCQVPLTSRVPDTFRNSINNLAVQRFRQQSECSIESTDSESFIVFDDGDDDDFKKEEIRMKIEKNDFDSDDDDVYEEEEEEEDGDNDDDDDTGDEDSDNEGDSSDDDDDACSCDKEILEANDKWAKNYKDVVPIDDERNKKVRFNDNVKVNTMIAWDYAYRAARTGPWEQMARDRDRFKERISRLSSAISPVLGKQHRDKIYKELHS